MKINAIKVHQPLGDFYISKIKAGDLLNISYTEVFRYKKDGSQEGTQRPVDEKRLKEISNFIKSEEMCFPSSILIALNNDPELEYIQSETQDNAFNIHCIGADIYELTIPDDKKCALIIDGQHRLKAFQYVDEELQNIELVCSIFFDLPNPYQAYLFATINGNQKKVDKSLALEFFGYNVEDEPNEQWTPEKLAVFLTRKLNFKKDSPLYHQLKLAASYDDNENDKKLASTAAMAEGILSLISSNPKRDRDIISATKNSIFKKKNRQIVSDQKDSTSLRKLYLECRDQEIYDILVAYFFVVDRKLWRCADENSVIKKTIGILALFDLLKNIIKQNGISDLSNTLFETYVKSFEFVDFSNNYFSTSGIGQGRMKRVIKYLSEISTIDSLKQEDIEFLQNGCNGHYLLLRFVRSEAYNYAKFFYTQDSYTERLPQIDIEQSIAVIIDRLYSCSANNHVINDIFFELYNGEKDFYDMLYEYVNYSDLESECVSGFNDAGKFVFGDRFSPIISSVN